MRQFVRVAMAFATAASLWGCSGADEKPPVCRIEDGSGGVLTPCQIVGQLSFLVHPRSGEPSFALSGGTLVDVSVPGNVQSYVELIVEDELVVGRTYPLDLSDIRTGSTGAPTMSYMDSNEGLWAAGGVLELTPLDSTVFELRLAEQQFAEHYGSDTAVVSGTYEFTADQIACQTDNGVFFGSQIPAEPHCMDAIAIVNAQ